MRTTINRVNKALEDASKEHPELEGVEIIKDNGHFYFADKDDSPHCNACSWYTSVVDVYHLNAYTPDEWVQEALKLARE